MSATEKPVWAWLPGLPDPVRCGSFTLENRVGRFAYDAAYRARPDALALDPIALPFTRSTRPWSEVRQGGLFGVFRDASPEGFGLAVLEQLRGQNLVEPLQRLEFSVGDAAGAIEVCDDSKTLAMAITRDGSSIATAANLLRNCDNFGYETAEARVFIECAKGVVTQEFEAEIETAGFERGTLGSWNCEWLGE